jgi:hypothetical protein
MRAWRERLCRCLRAARRAGLNPAEGGELTDQNLADVMTAAVRLYAARSEARSAFPPPLLADKVTATEVATVVSEMVRVVDLNMFDLSMWHGRPRPQ